MSSLYHLSIAWLSFMIWLMPAAIFAQTAAPARDFTKGFEKFYQLGLPDVSDAEYIAFDSRGYNHGDMSGSALKELGFGGNAWQIGETKAGTGRIIYAGRQLTVTSVKHYYKVMAVIEAKKISAAAKQKEMDAFLKTPRLYGEWKKADLKEDIKTILTFFSNFEANKEKFEWLERRGGVAQLFLFAASIGKKGYKTEANQIVAHLFQHAKNPRHIILKALNRLADAQYLDVFDEFSRHPDWSSYAQNISNLLKKYPQGWTNAHALKKLLPLIQQRIADKDEPLLKGSHWTAEDHQIIRTLINSTGESMNELLAHDTLWLISPLTAPDRDGAQKQKAPAPAAVAQKVMKKGVHIVPLLTVLLESDRLTGIDHQQLGYGRYFETVEIDGAVSETQIEKIFNALPRPATLSEVARTLLSRILLPLGGRYSSYSELSPEEYAEEAAAWYDAYKGFSKEQLAFVYFQKGDETQQRIAFNHLSSFTDKINRQAIEDELMAAIDKRDNFNLVYDYVKQNRSAVKAFAANYVKALQNRFKKTSAGMNDEERKYRKSDLETRINAINSLVDDKSLESLLDEIASGKIDFRAVGDVVFEKLAQIKSHEAVGLLLEAARKTQEPRLRMQLINYTTRIPSLTDSNAGSDGQTSQKEKSGESYHVKMNADLWKIHLEDSQTIETREPGNRMTVGDLSAYCIEYLASGLDFGKVKLLGERGFTLLKVRAQKRIEGLDQEQIAPWPAAGQVPAKRRSAIIKMVGEMTSNALPDYLKGLTLTELLVVRELLTGHKDLYEKFMPVTNQVKDVTVTSDHWPEEALTKTYQGQPLSPKMIKNLLDFCVSKVQAGKLLTCFFSRDPLFGGIHLTIEEISPTSELAKRLAYAGKALVFGFLRSNDSQLVGQSQWMVSMKRNDKGAPSSKEDDSLEDIEAGFMAQNFKESQAQFWKTVEQACGPVHSPASDLLIFFAGVSRRGDS